MTSKAREESPEALPLASVLSRPPCLTNPATTSGITSGIGHLGRWHAILAFWILGTNTRSPPALGRAQTICFKWVGAWNPVRNFGYSIFRMAISPLGDFF